MASCLGPQKRRHRHTSTARKKLNSDKQALAPKHEELRHAVLRRATFCFAAGPAHQVTLAIMTSYVGPMHPKIAIHRRTSHRCQLTRHVIFSVQLVLPSQSGILQRMYGTLRHCWIVEMQIC